MSETCVVEPDDAQESGITDTAWIAIRDQLHRYAVTRLARGDVDRQHDFVHDGLLAVAEAVSKAELDPQHSDFVGFAVNRGRSRMLDSYRRDARYTSRIALRATPDDEAPDLDGGPDTGGSHLHVTIRQGDGPLAQVVAKDEAEALRQQLALLPSRDRALLIAIFFMGRTSADVAREQGVTRAAVNQRKLRALGALRHNLARLYIGAN